MTRLGRLVIPMMMLLSACGGAAASADPAAPIGALTTSPPAAAAVAPTTTTTAASHEVAIASPTTTTTSAPKAPKAPITLGFAGDVAFTHGLDGRDPFGRVTEMVAAPDLTIANLETTVGEPGVGSAVDKSYVFKSPPRSVGLLADAGIDVVSLANNHTLDYRREGLLRTIELLDEGSVGYFGAGPDSAAAYAPHVVEVGDWRIGIVGFTHIECGWVADDLTRWAEAAWACPGFEERTIEAVADASEDVDFVVVMVHWGIEKAECPEAYQRELAAAWVDAGADLIIGSHPHVLQGLEQIDGVWVVHSIGNFAFPSARNVSALSAFFTAELSDAGVRIMATPIDIVEGRPRLMGEAAAAEMLSDLSRWSFGWDFGADGTPAPRSEPGTCG